MLEAIRDAQGVRVGHLEWLPNGRVVAYDFRSGLAHSGTWGEAERVRREVANPSKLARS